MNAKRSLRSLLSGGDRRSIGRVAEVVDFIAHEPSKIPLLVGCLFDKDACVRMRAADALEKISRERAESVQPCVPELLGLLTETTQQEVRWHLALILPRLRLTPPQSDRVVEALYSYLEDRSSIVKTSALQGLADLTAQQPALRSTILESLHVATRVGTPAMRARGRKLLKEI